MIRGLLLASVVLLAGCTAADRAAPAPSDSFTVAALPAADYALPTSPGSILVIVDHTDNDAYDRDHGAQVAIALRHFTPNTTWKFIDRVFPQDVKSVDAVVYLGEDDGRLTPGELNVFREARHLIVSRFHVDELHDAGIAFPNVYERGDVAAADRKLTISYKDERIAYAADDYVDYDVRGAARVHGVIHDGARSAPFAIVDGNATYVNGTFEFDDAPTAPRLAHMPIVCDLFAAGLGAEPRSREHIAMLRLEDVSVQTQATRLRAIVSYLASQHIAYGIGVIPEQLIRGQTLSTLREDPELVTILTWAQSHGATLILHGLHHSFNSAEDFEFWDDVHDRPLPQDSLAWMRGKLTEGLRTERALGLQPKMWETPHYSASPLDYGVTHEFFNAAWEDRLPAWWAPWVLQKDAYGQMLLPEDLGYVAVAFSSDSTLQAQLAKARALRVCDECVAAGFLHPATVRLADVIGYVDGLRTLGYRFADPARYLAEAASST